MSYDNLIKLNTEVLWNARMANKSRNMHNYLAF